MGQPLVSRRAIPWCLQVYVQARLHTSPFYHDVFTDRLDQEEVLMAGQDFNRFAAWSNSVQMENKCIV